MDSSLSVGSLPLGDACSPLPGKGWAPFSWKMPKGGEQRALLLLRRLSSKYCTYHRVMFWDVMTQSPSLFRCLLLVLGKVPRRGLWRVSAQPGSADYKGQPLGALVCLEHG